MSVAKYRNLLTRDPVAGLRVVGLVTIAAICLLGALARADSSAAGVAVCAGVLSIASFLWLVATGFFGYGSLRRSDWIGLVPFIAAVVVRELLTLHSVQEIEIQFARGPIGRHSVVYPLLQMFFEPMVRDAHVFVMHMNGLLGGLACLGAYMFVKQRIGSRSAGFLSAVFLALHPVVARFAPTDGPYSLLLATWFAGLALLATRPLNARALFGGTVLLGIAATTRLEGLLFLGASALMLDRRSLLDAARRQRVVTVLAFFVVYALGAVQMYFLLPTYLSGAVDVTSVWQVLLPRARWLFDDAVWSASYNHPVFAGLVLAGAVAGIATRYRLALLAFLGMILVLAPVAGSWNAAFMLHRMVPACALQAMIAGIGAHSLVGWIPSPKRWRWLVVIPGSVAAVWMLVQRRADLTQPFVFNEEYELVRSHLAPHGKARTDCTLLTLNAHVSGDCDIHDFAQVVPGVRVLDCGRSDCLAELSNDGCFYYVRSAACYLSDVATLPVCAARGMSATGDRLTCLNALSASFETSVELESVETRVIDIRGTFPDNERHYPDKAEVGLFRVRRKAHESDPAVRPAPPSSFREDPEAPDDVPVVPPGQEDVLALMLGRGTMLAGECTLSAVDLMYTAIRATYTCGRSDSVFELVHPSRVTRATVKTERFAITLKRGIPPPGLQETLEANVRAGEAGFKWAWVPKYVLSPAVVPILLSGFVGMLGLAVLLRRPRKRPL